MNADVSYSVKLDKGITKWIPVNSGVKQWCDLSPILLNFSCMIFLIYFCDECDPVICDTLKMNCLMFADDPVFFSESAPGLQNCLNKLNTYTKKWNLKVNINKTKIVVFNKGGKTEHLDFYQGIILNAAGSFSNVYIINTDKAMKAFFKLKQINPREITLLTLKSFGSLVTHPHVLWLWSLPPIPPALRKISKSDFKLLCDSFHVEQMNTKLNEYVLGVSKCATNAAVMGELGRFPIAFRIVKHAPNHWKNVQYIWKLCC